MKLRIQGNSIRFRLTRPEVAELAERGSLSEAVLFQGGQRLEYLLASSTGASRIDLTFERNQIRVSIPAGEVMRWSTSEEVGMENTNCSPSVLIEKDFQCLHKAPEEDAYPNPEAVSS